MLIRLLRYLRRYRDALIARYGELVSVSPQDYGR